MVETIPYTYDSTWKDKLTSFGGAAIQSDALGNVTSDGVWSYTWEGGRRLAGMSKSGTNVTFRYDENGQRIRKEVNGVVTEYTVQGKRVVHVKHSTLGEMHIYYDGGRPNMAMFNGTMYRYVHSLQGDILGLQDGAGTMVVYYRYDAWGRLTSQYGSLVATLGSLNPFRYRGYVYDEETALYYLRSRYYNPWWGRFISTDSILGQVGGLLQHNLFAYCCNSPIIYFDADGYHFALSPELEGGGMGGITGGISGGWISLGTHGSSSIIQVLQTILLGTLLGLSYPHSSISSDDAKSNEEKEKTHIHHIVAQKSVYAFPARSIYTMYFDINDPINLIAVPASKHSRLHTFLYYTNVNMQITQDYLLGEIYGKEGEYIKECMSGLRTQISTGTILF